MKLAKILAAVDLSPASGHALKGALHLADTSGAELTVLHVCGKGKTDEATELLSAFVSTWRSHSGHDGPLKKVVVEGRDAYAILAHAHAEQVDLIVCGADGRSALQRLLLGNVAEKLIRMSGCPVWVVRPTPTQEPVRSIALALESLETGQPAIDVGRALQKLFDATLEVVHVLPQSLAETANLVDTIRNVRENLQAAFPDCVIHVETGEPATGILSHGKDLIVCGTHQRKGLQHWILGSVAEKVVREATGSVLTVPLHERKDEQGWWSTDLELEGIAKDGQDGT